MGRTSDLSGKLGVSSPLRPGKWPLRSASVNALQSYYGDQGCVPLGYSREIKDLGGPVSKQKNRPANAKETPTSLVVGCEYFCLGASDPMWGTAGVPMVSSTIGTSRQGDPVVPLAPDPSTRLLTSVEAAAQLRISRRTLERYRVTGTGPRYLKVGPGSDHGHRQAHPN